MKFPYHKIMDDPVTYQMGTDHPLCEISINEDYSIWKEGNVLDVKAIPFPFTIIDHADIFHGLSQFMQPCLISGYYEGKPVIGMGNYDRIYRASQDKRDIGEDPISVNSVEMDARWVHLPYVDDGTVTYENADFQIGPKTIHFMGKWGTKGLTPYPRYERHGQSEVLGTWYTGDTPYKHKLYFSLNENMEAYDYKLEKFGFQVSD